ncbi:TM2 domain-containing protein [Haliea sp. E1-2-M8]|uniref:TM2 domain-containing protein n=1 Tax=Haliea sp. E1-2-M8 TaxID=3064706 RepID=UPI00271EFC1A|nr:TM2 domain-containing protein [Haliea sp. E1-2-M8]MDO8862718.1 TM2 domain-containing protein [Haliea sp. E1-2-M8]
MLEAFTLKQRQVREEDERLREAIRSLSDSERIDFYRSYNESIRDPDTYAVLNWFFLAGLHHFYLGNWVRGSLNLVVMATGIFFLLLKPELGLTLIAGILLIEIPALLRSQIIVEHHNTQVGWKLLQQVHTASPRTWG